MNLLPINVPFCISPLENHETLKPRILFEILTQQNASPVIDPHDDTNITRCDWQGHSKDRERPWVKTLMPHLTSHLSKWTELAGFKSFLIRELWFQQYGIDSGHDWHIHGCNWTGVYFLDLPDPTLKTQFKDPMNTGIINEFNVKEGDILIFPSFVIHKAPKNNNVRIKTIISWNMDIELRSFT